MSIGVANLKMLMISEILYGKNRKLPITEIWEGGIGSRGFTIYEDGSAAGTGEFDGYIKTIYDLSISTLARFIKDPDHSL